MVQDIGSAYMEPKVQNKLSGVSMDQRVDAILKWKQNRGDFIDHPSYAKSQPHLLHEKLETNIHFKPLGKASPVIICDMFPNLSRFPLLTSYGEQFLFKKFNYIKALIHRRYFKKLPLALTKRQYNNIEKLISAADATREILITSNLRMAVKFCMQRFRHDPQLEFMLTESYMCLMKAVEKFDVHLGFKFSTYACNAMWRGLYRLNDYNKLINSKALQLDMNDCIFDECFAQNAVAAAMINEEMGNIKDIMDHCLNPREYQVIIRRYMHGETLVAIGGLLRISKERVRQIEMAAINKIRDFI